MAIVLYPDLIKDSRFYESFAPTGILTAARIDRAYYVDGAPTTNREQIQALCKEAVQAVVPIGTPHPRQTAALAREYRAEPWSDHDGCEVVVSYVYDGYTGLSNDYSIEVSGGVRQVATDSEFDGSGNLIPIEVAYNREWASITATRPINTDLYYASVTDMPVLRPVGNVVLTKRINSTKAQAIEDQRDDYLGFTNSSNFRGKDANTYLCSEVTTVAQPYQGDYIARARWDYLPETWDAWARFRNDQFGVPANIWRDWNSTYTSAAGNNGFKRCKAYLRADMNALFTLITG